MSQAIWEAYVSIKPDARNFRRETEQQIQSSLAGLKAEVPTVTTGNAKGEIAGTAAEVGQLAQAQRGSAAAGATMGSSLAQVAVRLGLIGFAAGAGYLAIRKLGDAMRVTGDEAYTFTGRLRNAFSDLTRGDVVGVFKDLFSSQKADFSSDITKQLEQIRREESKLYIDEQKLIDVRKRGKDALDAYIAGLELTGAISDEVGEDLAKITEILYQQERAAKASAAALADVEAAITAAGSAAAAFGERGGPDGRGPGGVDATNRRPGTGVTSETDSTNTPATQAAIAAERARQTETLQDDLRQAKKDLATIRETNENLRKVKEGRAERRLQEEQAETRVAEIERQIAERAAAAAEERKRAREERRRAAEQEAADRLQARQMVLENAVAAAELTPGLADNRRALNALMAFWQEQFAAAKKVGDALRAAEAQSGIQSVRGRIAALNEQAAAEEEAKRQRNEQAREQALQNEVSKARLTEDKGDDRKALNALLRFWRRKLKAAQEAGDALAREQAQAQVIATRADIQALDEKPKKPEERRSPVFDILRNANQIFEGFASNIAQSNLPSSLRPGDVAAAQQAAGGQTATERNTTALERNTRALERADRAGGVTIKQEFKDPAIDRGREARQAAYAFRAGFET